MRRRRLIDRRALLTLGLFSTLRFGALGCAAKPAKPSSIPVAPPPEPADRIVGPLTDLLAFPRLKWLISLRPERLSHSDWLQPHIARFIQAERLELLVRATGLDLTAIPDTVVAGYGDGDDDAVMWIVRHRADQLALERKFRERLTSDESRSQLDHQLVGVWGKVGSQRRGFIAVGRDVAGYQYGGSARRGPARIGLLYEQGKLAKIPTALAEPTLGHVDQILGLAPAKLLIVGPFDGDSGRGLRGLLAGSSGVGASLAPTEQQQLRLIAIIAGDYGRGPDRDEALGYLRAAWDDLAATDLGHLLGLHQPVSGVEVMASPLGLTLKVDLDADTLFDGIAAATVANVRELMQ